MKEITALIKNENLGELASLKEALAINNEAIQRQNTVIGILKRELTDQDTKIEIAGDLNLPLRSFRQYRIRLIKQIESAERTVLAYRAGYLEVPDFGQGQEIKESDDHYYEWKFNVSGKTPLRVLRVLKEAKDKGIFEKIVVFQRGRDPIITGKIGNLYFFITSYK